MTGAERRSLLSPLAKILSKCRCFKNVYKGGGGEAELTLLPLRCVRVFIYGFVRVFPAASASPCLLAWCSAEAGGCPKQDQMQGSRRVEGGPEEPVEPRVEPPRALIEFRPVCRSDRLPNQRSTPLP